MIEPYLPTAKGTARSMLLEGMHEVRSAVELSQQAESQRMAADFGGFPPASVPWPTESWANVDNLIRSRMSGKRVGTKIEWQVREGRYRFDPMSGRLEKVN